MAERVQTSMVQGDAKITLGLLNAVEVNSQITQRSMARELGIALGLANTYLKRCVRKGWVKVTSVPANRYAYFLTPKGFAEKSRLTAEFLTVSLDFFRRARDQCAIVLDYAVAQGWRRVALAGASDLTEIAILCARDYDVDIVGVVDPKINRLVFAALPVSARLDGLGSVDAVIVTDLRDAQQVFDTLIKSLPQGRILTPALLRVSRVRPKLAD